VTFIIGISSDMGLYTGDLTFVTLSDTPISSTVDDCNTVCEDGGPHACARPVGAFRSPPRFKLDVAEHFKQPLARQGSFLRENYGDGRSPLQYFDGGRRNTAETSSAQRYCFFCASEPRSA